MATVSGLTAEQMQKIAGESIISARMSNNNLILTTRGGDDIDLGQIRLSQAEMSDLVATVVPDLVDERISEQPGFEDAAELAVSQAMVNADLVKGTDTRISQVISTDKWLWGLANPEDNVEGGLDDKARFWAAGGMHPDMGLPYVDDNTIFDYALMLSTGQVPYGVIAGRSFIAQLHEKSPIRARKIDVRSQLEDGEALPNDGVHDAWPLFKRTHDFAKTQVAFGAVTVFAPEGLWRMTQDLVVFGVSWVGFEGESEGGTILLPEGTASAFKARIDSGGYDGPEHEGLLFKNFTIDGKNQGGDGVFTNVKGIYIQRLIRSRFENVTIKNVAATGFGVDFLDDVWFINCTADNCGRLIQGDSSTGAGFGFATGYRQVENIRMMNCTSKNNRSHGVFLERSASRLANLPGAPNGYRSMGFVMIGCWMENNYDGYFGAGGNAALLQGNVFYRNRYAGIFIDENTTTTIADDLTQIKDNIIWGNGWDATTAGSNSDNRSGIRIKGTKVGIPPVIDGNIIGFNDGWGIKITDALPGEGLRITNNQIFESWYSGVSITSGTGPHRCRITDNDVWNNGRGQTGVDGEQDGIVVNNRVINRGRFSDNNIWDRRAVGSKTQRRGLVLSGGNTWDRPRVRDNDVDGNADAGLVDTLSVSTDRRFISGNE